MFLSWHTTADNHTYYHAKSQNTPSMKSFQFFDPTIVLIGLKYIGYDIEINTFRKHFSWLLSNIWQLQALWGTASRTCRTKWMVPLDSARPRAWETTRQAMNLWKNLNLNTRVCHPPRQSPIPVQLNHILRMDANKRPLKYFLIPWWFNYRTLRLNVRAP